MTKILAWISFYVVFTMSLNAATLKEVVDKLANKSDLIKSSNYLTKSKRSKMLASKELRHINPILSTSATRVDGKTSLGARISNSLYNSSKDYNQYRKDILLYEVSKMDHQIVIHEEKIKIAHLFVDLLKAQENLDLYHLFATFTEKALNKQQKSSKLNITSKLNYEEARLDHEEMLFQRDQAQNEVSSIKNSIKFYIGDDKIDLDNNVPTNRERFQVSSYKEILKKILESENNPFIEKYNKLVKVSDIDREIGLSTYNLNVNASTGAQYFKNELDKNNDWQGSWILTLNANYPAFAQKSKKYFDNAYQHKIKADEATKDHQAFELSLEVLTLLEELDLFYRLYDRVNNNIYTMKKYWDERDLLYYKTSITTFKQFLSILQAELNIKLNAINLKSSILRNEATLAIYLGEL